MAIPLLFISGANITKRTTKIDIKSIEFINAEETEREGGGEERTVLLNGGRRLVQSALM